MRMLLIILVLFVGCNNSNPVESDKIYGCTDSTACNFNSDANVYEPNSCLYNDIDNSIDVDKTEDNKSFYELIDHLDCKFNKLIKKRNSLYIRMNESLQFLYGSFCDALLESKRYLYIRYLYF